jgi:antirestriction protein ArdC
MANDIAQTITDRIISELEQGAAPWVKPWRSLRGTPANGLAYNPASGTVYRGINQFWLNMMQAAYPSNQWVTFKQAQGLGGTVRAGEKGTGVVYWNVNKKETTDANGDTVTSAYAFIKQYWVFNVSQCENLDLPEPEPVPVADWVPEASVMDIVDRLALSGDLSHGGDSAYYRPSTDEIVMPPMAAFNSPENYHATLLHESVHATGHEKRLKRLTPARFGSSDYAYEELVAELGAAMLCAHCGIDGDLRHSGYIESWLKALKNDKQFILSAAGKAQAAMDYLTKTSQAEEALAA